MSVLTPTPTSVYPVTMAQSAEHEAVLAVTVDNEPGVLARVVAMVSARGYNIESLTVAEVDSEQHRSRITILTNGTTAKIDQIKAQLGRLVPVQKVVDLSAESGLIERELSLVKIACDDDEKAELMHLAERHLVRVIDSTRGSLVFELTGTRSEIDAFIAMVRPLGRTEVSRTGILSIRRGLEDGA